MDMLSAGKLHCILSESCIIYWSFPWSACQDSIAEAMTFYCCGNLEPVKLRLAVSKFDFLKRELINIPQILVSRYVPPR